MLLRPSNATKPVKINRELQIRRRSILGTIHFDIGYLYKLKEQDRGILINEERLNHLRYANNAILINADKEELKRILTGLEKET